WSTREKMETTHYMAKWSTMWTATKARPSESTACRIGQEERGGHREQGRHTQHSVRTQHTGTHNAASSSSSSRQAGRQAGRRTQRAARTKY
ncbi:hypothetical protein M514_06356, partial [Trichuris suis]